MPVPNLRPQFMMRLAVETEFSKRYGIWTEIQRWFWEEVPNIKFGDFFILRIKQKQVMGYANMNRPFFWNVWLAAK